MDAIALHRVAHRLYRAGVPLVPRALDYLIFLLFNSVVHHSTQIGRGTRCGYKGMSVLIHRDAVVGCDVEIGAHVVIGGRSGHDGFPIIENGVYLGVNSCVLGQVRVGADAVVGAAAVVLDDVPPGTAAVGNPARIVDRASVVEGGRRRFRDASTPGGEQLARVSGSRGGQRRER